MDEKQQVVRKRVRRGEAEVAALYADFQQSGLSVGEYCRRHSVSRSSLWAIVARRRMAGSHGSHHAEQVSAATSAKHASTAKIAPPAAASARAFIPVEIVPTDAHEERSSLHVELPRGARIAVARRFDEDTLLRLIAVLERA